MKTICAGCQKHIKGDPNDKDISHGMCKSCAKEMMDAYEEHRSPKYPRPVNKIQENKGGYMKKNPVLDISKYEVYVKKGPIPLYALYFGSSLLGYYNDRAMIDKFGKSWKNYLYPKRNPNKTHTPFIKVITGAGATYRIPKGWTLVRPTCKKPKCLKRKHKVIKRKLKVRRNPSGKGLISKLSYFKKDEGKAVKEYNATARYFDGLAKQVKTFAAPKNQKQYLKQVLDNRAKMFRAMAADEKKHAGWIKQFGKI